MCMHEDASRMSLIILQHISSLRTFTATLPSTANPRFGSPYPRLRHETAFAIKNKPASGVNLDLALSRRFGSQTQYCLCGPSLRDSDS